ncbi:MAG: hypothetical protein L0228_18385 [Planctomycetes bacterium]|nr:hypothetical protein [Planctomycetota bacterium]
MVATSLSLFTLFTLVAGPAVGQQKSTSPASTVRKASFDRSPPGAVQTVRFHKRPARADDQVEQTLALEMRMATTLRQGNEVTERSQTKVRNDQRRVVTATHIEAGRTVAVRVRYLEATKQLSATENAQPAATSDDVSKTSQPVAGKTYFCQREPGENGKLAITYEDGNIPPSDECQIVAQHMEMLGRANPLAEFLADKTVAIGDTIEVPRETAGKIFNVGKLFGEVAGCSLTLKKLESHDAGTHAVFLARVEAASNNASQMRLQVEGPLAVQVDTCRVVNLDLSGPIAMSETRGSFSTSYQAIGTGQVKLSIASTYRDAKR